MQVNAKDARPRIGVVPSREGERITLNERYMDAVWCAGGIAVPLAYTEDAARLAAYAAQLDGFLFSGGADVDPALYREEKRYDSVEIDGARDAFEQGLFAAVYPTGKPILGICRGIQSINVFLGGTLHQHKEGHSQAEDGTCRRQAIRVQKGSMLHRLCGKTALMVNSFHHQAVKEAAPGLAVDAVSEDGLIEALHAVDHPFLLAVQFHPERYHACPDDDHAGLLFKAFVDACR